MKANRKGRISSHSVKQEHKPAKGFIRSCTASLIGLKINLREETPESKLAKSRNGFTLIEIMIVVCIIGILSSIAYPSMVARLEYARAVKVRVNTNTLNLAVNDYMLRLGAMETTFGGIDDPDKWVDVEKLIPKGFDNMQIEGYSMHLEHLNYCYMSQVIFVPTSVDIYTKFTDL